MNHDTRSQPVDCKGDQPRRGAVLLIVLGVAMIVAIVALSTLLLNRQLSRRSRLVNDSAQADCLARSGLQIGAHAIQADDNWRTTYSDGSLVDGLEIVGGTINVVGLDPTDGNLDNGDRDPVRLVSTGSYGNSTRALIATLQPTTEVCECLHSLIHAGGSLTGVTSTVYGKGQISVNGNVNLFGNSSLFTDLSTAGTIIGADSIKGEVTVLEGPLAMPVPLEVIERYVATGTPINLPAVTLIPPTIAENGDFNSGVTPWFAKGSGTLSIANVGRADSTSLKISTRSSSAAGPGQDVTGKLVKGGKLDAQCWVTHNSPEPDTGPGPDPASFLANESYAIFVEVVSTDGTTQLQMTPWVTTSGNWVHLSGSLISNWPGTLQKATCYVRSQSHKFAFWIDDFVLEEDVSDFTLIHRVVFGPNHNPFGAATNERGIYVIDCGNQSLALDRVRVQGTLVLRNVGSSCILRGAPCHFQPAISGYPIIVADGNITIEATDDGLVEKTAGVNYNPGSAPYAAQSDSSLDDIYQSTLDGLIYSTGTIQIGHESPVTGPVIAHQDVVIDNATLRELRFRRHHSKTLVPGFTKQALVLERNSIRESAPMLPETTGSEPPVDPGGDLPFDSPVGGPAGLPGGATAPGI